MHSSSLHTGADTSFGSVLGSEISMEPSTLALLWGRRGLDGAAGWAAVESAAEAAAGAATAPLGLSSWVWLRLRLSWSIP